VLGSLSAAPDQPHIDIPLVLRLPVAAAIVAWGAWTDRKWTVPLAAALAMPVLWIASFSVLAAIPAVGRPELESKAETARRHALAAPAPAAPAAPAVGAA